LGTGALGNTSANEWTQRKPTRFLCFAGTRDEFCCGGMMGRAEIVSSLSVSDSRRALRAESIRTPGETNQLRFALNNITGQGEDFT